MAVNGARGLTLVELLVVLAMMGILGTALFQVFQVHNRQALIQEETALMQQELLSAMVIMADAIRLCGYSPNPNPQHSFGFNATSPSELWCTRDMNGNGTLDSNDDEIVRLRFNATTNTIQYFSTGNVAWQPLAVQMGDLQFTYLDSNENTPSDVDAIRMVRINATAIPSPRRQAMGVRNRTMSTVVQIRNLR